MSRATAKLNLGLYLGPTREDGLHEICSIFHPLELSDHIKLGAKTGGSDEVICVGVEGENLASRALVALREAGWDGPPMRIEIQKRIPVAAGLGGGSADAAAVLRLAWRGPEGVVAGRSQQLEDDLLLKLAAGLGADVPSQLLPAPALVRGAGELVEQLPDPAEYGVLLIPDRRGLSTPAVYAEADRLGLGRSAQELDALADRLRVAAGPGVSPLEYKELLVNDLAEAAVSLSPDIDDALAALEEVGAELTLVTGSGPTAVGLFRTQAEAAIAAKALPAAYADAIVTGPDRTHAPT